MANFVRRLSGRRRKRRQDEHEQYAELMHISTRLRQCCDELQQLESDIRQKKEKKKSKKLDSVVQRHKTKDAELKNLGVGLIRLLRKHGIVDGDGDGHHDNNARNFVPYERYKHMENLYERERREKEAAIMRLSSIASNRLRDNNPNIVDLSDENRPTKIGEKFSELYDNQWTDAFDVLNEKERNTESESIGILLKILMETHRHCQKEANNSMERMKDMLGDDGNQSREIVKEVKECRKRNVEYFIQRSSPVLLGFKDEQILEFSRECLRLCWLMAVQDPQLCLHTPDVGDTELNTKHYREYTARGPFLQYVVWPPLLLHKDGPIIGKGVAQGGHNPPEPRQRPTTAGPYVSNKSYKEGPKSLTMTHDHTHNEYYRDQRHYETVHPVRTHHTPSNTGVGGREPHPPPYQRPAGHSHRFPLVARRAETNWPQYEGTTHLEMRSQTLPNRKHHVVDGPIGTDV